MKKTSITLKTALAATLGLCAAAPLLTANTILLNEDWSGYTTPTSSLQAPWTLAFGGGSTPSASKIDIVNQTIAGTTANWALVNNSANNEPVGNPVLRTVFEMSNLLDISFSFMVPQNYGNTSQALFTLGHINSGGTVTNAISLYLGPNYQATNSALGYRSSTNTRVNLINSFTAGQLVTVMLTNVNGATGTYDIAWSTSGGLSGSVTDIVMTTPSTSQFNYISFGENSAVTSISQLYVGPVMVTQVPEPTTAAIATAIGALGFAFYRRRKAVR